MNLKTSIPKWFSIRMFLAVWIAGTLVFVGGCSSPGGTAPRVDKEVFSGEGELQGFSGGGQYVVAITDISSKLGVWETATGVSFASHSNFLGAHNPEFSFNPIDTTLVIQSNGTAKSGYGPISLRSIVTGEVINNFERAAYYYPIFNPVFSTDGQMIYGLRSDGNVIRFETGSFLGPEPGGVTVTETLTDHTGKVHLGETSLGNGLINNGIDVTDINPRYEITALVSEIGIETCSYTDGSKAVRIRTDAILTIRDIETGAQIGQASFQGQTPPACPERKPAEILLEVNGWATPELDQWVMQELSNLPGTRIPGVTLFHLSDLMTGQEQTDYQNAAGLNGQNSHILVSPDGKYLLVRIDHDAWVWDLVENTFIRRIQVDPPFILTPDRSSYLFSKDDYTLVLADTLTGEEKVQLTEDFGPLVLNAAFSPNGKLLATASYNYHGVIIWNMETGKQIHQIPTQWLTDRVFFSGDGKWLAFGDIFSFQVWEIDNNE